MEDCLSVDPGPWYLAEDDEYHCQEGKTWHSWTIASLGDELWNGPESSVFDDVIRDLNCSHEARFIILVP